MLCAYVDTFPLRWCVCVCVCVLYVCGVCVWCVCVYVRVCARVGFVRVCVGRLCVVERVCAWCGVVELLLRVALCVP